MKDSPVRVAPVRRVGSDTVEDPDLLAVEEPVSLQIEHGPDGARRTLDLGVLMRTPGDDSHLAAGMLYAEAIIHSRNDIRTIGQDTRSLRVSLADGVAVDERLASRVFARASACGVCGRDAIDDLRALGAPPVPNVKMGAQVLHGLPAALRARQQVFNETGGLHAAALFDERGELLSIAEDIGRHNAVDKLVGRALMNGMVPSPAAALLVSGRVAFEIVHKVVRAGVPILAAVGAPSSLAVETARDFNLTLIGFLREDRFNIYSGFDRIV